jgi:hypothetical protein
MCDDPAVAVPRRKLILVLLAAVAALGAVGDAVGAARTPRARAAGIAPGTSFSAFAAQLLTRPAPVKGTDGFVHLAYELVLTNVAPRTLRLDLVQVRDARGHRVLLSLRGAQLSASVHPVGGPTASEAAVSSGARELRSSEEVIVWLDVRLHGGVPAVIDHRVVASFVSASGAAGQSIDGTMGRVSTVRHSAIVLGPPVAPGIWYASEGCCSDDTHHRRGLAPINGQLLVPQRFAIDWYRLDSHHRVWVGDRRRLGSYLAFRQPVIAAADARVVETQDGLPDNPDLPKNPPIPPIENTVGNHVVLQVAPHVYLLYAHLTPRSIKVHRGQRVHRGQVLGLLGTSGNSTIPHLHFQVMTTATFFPTDSAPYVFGRFDLLGHVPERIWDENMYLQPTGMLPFVPAAHAGTRMRQLPLDRDVISLPAPR